MLKGLDHSFSSTRAQVAGILLEYAGNSSNKQNCLSQREIANMLGKNIHQVNLSMQSLYNEGLIRIECRRVIIKKKLLQKLANISR
jgi:predicted transcriptional regulator